MKYRPEIDGLRAVAVIPVILFHAGFSTFSGGFVGVDIFFVISGYLITTIILSEMEQGTFSIINFYERRARRILPALFLVMLFSLLFAWLWLMPSDMKSFSQSLVAVSIFSSNIFFWRESGYWDTASEFKPLLHTWSLAVEEQYYVFFPIFLLVMWRFGKRWIISSFILVTGISFAAAEWGAYHKPSATFYLLPTRGWELAIGAGIAFYFFYRKQIMQNLFSHKLIDEIFGFLGLFMIGYAIFVFDERTPFPSFYSLVPTLGTGLLILFLSDQTLVGRLLSAKPILAIGLISYSAYLWHQPLFAFARHRSLTEPSEFIYAVLIFITISLAYLSWRYVEKPFRTKGLLRRQEIFSFALTISGIFIFIGLTGHFSNGFEGRFATDELSNGLINQRLKVNYGLSETCEGKFTLSVDCRTDDKPEILVWGDSYAMHLVQGIIASNPNAKIVQMTKSACGPFFDISPVTREFPVNWAKGCLDFTEEVRKWIKANDSVKYAVVSSLFSQYISDENKLLLRNGEFDKPNIDFVTKEFVRTLDELKSLGITPVVFSPPPANSMDLGRCLVKAKQYNVALDECDFDIAHMATERKHAYELLDRINRRYRVIRLDKLICDDYMCKSHIGDNWIFRDNGHLSYEGSKTLGEKYSFYELIIENEQDL